MSLYPLARPEDIELSEVVKERFLINEEAIREQKRVGITVDASCLAPGLKVHTWRLPLERVLDNLFNNATKAIPESGGFLRVSTCIQNEAALVEITNSGRITPEEEAKIRAAEVAGRGLNIVYRFVRSMGGKVDVQVDETKNTTTFRILMTLAPS